MANGGDLGRPALVLAAAFAAHNLEEGLTYAATRGHIADRIAALGLPWRSPDPTVAIIALLALTMGAAAVMFWAATAPATSTKRVVVRGLAWVMLANVLLPHVPAALALGGYTPGLITAVALSLPVALWVLRTTRIR